MAKQVLTLRRLNRATLQRQMLLSREQAPVTVAIERLAGLQAQLARPPYIGLWTRLQGFQRDALAALVEDRTVVKATWIRATLHLLTTDDYLRFRSTLQPMLTQTWSSLTKRRKTGFDLDQLLAGAADFIGEKPRTFAEISRMLSEWMPQEDVGAMRYAVRTHLPLAQVPDRSAWSYPNKPQFTLAESWTGRSVAAEDFLPELVLRYLTAFGPASVTDMQTWSGMAALKETFEQLRPQLRCFRDRQRELFDLPDRTLPEEDVPAPPRFLPEFDNLLLSHRDRRRIIADEHRSRVYLPGLRVAATFLVDGFVGGTWKVEKKRGTAALALQPFEKLSKGQGAGLVEEGERLVRFVEPKAKNYEVRFSGD